MEFLGLLIGVLFIMWAHRKAIHEIDYVDRKIKAGKDACVVCFNKNCTCLRRKGLSL